MRNRVHRLSGEVLMRTKHPPWIGNREAIAEYLKTLDGYEALGTRLTLIDKKLGWVPGNLYLWGRGRPPVEDVRYGRGAEGVR